MPAADACGVPVLAATSAAPTRALLHTGSRLAAELAAEIRREVPAATTIVDAHAHIGADEDGMVADADELQADLDAHGVARAFVFSLNAPDRAPAFRAPNDRVLLAAERSEGRLTAFARLDLDAGPVPEAERCFDRGAAGIKLHPRAQRFDTSDARLDPVFACAAERSAPILVHAGPGVKPGFAADLERLVDAHPGARLIVAHAGVADLPGLARRLGGREDVAFDTSTWSAVDLLDLLARVPPQQLLHASDYPYGQQPSALAVAIGAACTCGLDDHERRGLLGDSAARILAGKPLELTVVRGRAILCRSAALDRVHHYVSMAAAQLLRRRGDALSALELAVAAAGDGDARARRIGEMLRTAQALWHALREIDGDRDRREAARAAIQLLQLSDVLTVTALPIPEEARP